MIRLNTISDTPVERVVQGYAEVVTRGPGFTDITAALSRFVDENRLADGLLSAFVAHTTASLTVQENADPDVQADLLSALDRLAPRNAHYRHGSEGPDDMPGHIKAMLSDTCISVGVASRRLQLGTWQALYLIEHRDGGRTRQVRLNYIGR